MERTWYCYWKENQTVLVKHGSVYVPFHPSRLLLENSGSYSQITKEGITQAPTGRNQSISEDPESKIFIKESSMDDEYYQRTVEVNVFEDDSGSTDVSHRNEDTEDLNTSAKQQNSQKNSTASEEASTQEFLAPNTLPKGNITQLLQRLKTMSGKHTISYIISRAGKSTGKHLTSLNVEYSSTKEIK